MFCVFLCRSRQLSRQSFMVAQDVCLHTATRMSPYSSQNASKYGLSDLTLHAQESLVHSWLYCTLIIKSPKTHAMCQREHSNRPVLSTRIWNSKPVEKKVASLGITVFVWLPILHVFECIHNTNDNA